jgi:hypothetical protein
MTAACPELAKERQPRQVRAGRHNHLLRGQPLRVDRQYEHDDQVLLRRRSAEPVLRSAEGWQVLYTIVAMAILFLAIAAFEIVYSLQSCLELTADGIEWRFTSLLTQTKHSPYDLSHPCVRL